MDTAPSLPAASRLATVGGILTRILFRFFFVYFLLYALPIVLRFPVTFVSTLITQTSAATPGPDSWLAQTLMVLSYPAMWYQQGLNLVTPWVCQTLLGAEVAPPTRFSGSGDGLYQYAISFAYVIVAAAGCVLWTLASLAWQRWRTHRAPAYGRLDTLFRLLVRFHLLSQMLVYGAMKVFCNQFPPISDGQLQTAYGDSSPMGLLWRFMQASQPYTAFTGIVEFTCGLLLICRRTTLLGALCSAGATLQVFLLNMCYDVPVKLMSGHLLLMALVLIAPDAGRLFRFFVLGQPIAPRPLVPLFGWRWLDRVGLVLRTVVFVTYAGLMLNQFFQDARTNGIFAPERPMLGRWLVEEFSRNGMNVPIPPQPENPPPKPITPSKWQGGPNIPPVVRLAMTARNVVLMFEDGSGVNYRNASREEGELTLASLQTGQTMGELRATLPDSDTLLLEGTLGDDEVRLSLRRPRVPKREYLLKTRGFRWVQEDPFNR